MAGTTAKDLLSDPVHVSVRFNGALLQQLKTAAKNSLRSVNAEIILRIRDSFERGADEAKLKNFLRDVPEGDHARTAAGTRDIAEPARENGCGDA